VIEESPSPFVTAELRERMGSLAVALARRAGYVNAGTLEFLVDSERNPYFLEMNTRLQVEHPVTELVTGEDLVKLQIRIAQGEKLPFGSRTCASAARDRVPCLRRGPRPRLPASRARSARCARGRPGVRDDSGVYEGYTVPIHYDPLISKLVAYGYSRLDAIKRMRRAIAEYRILASRQRFRSSSACCTTRTSWRATSTPRSWSACSSARTSRASARSRSPWRPRRSAPSSTARPRARGQRRRARFPMVAGGARREPAGTPVTIRLGRRRRGAPA